MNPYNKTNQMH